MIASGTKKIRRRNFFGYLAAFVAAGPVFGSIGRLFRSAEKKEPVQAATAIIEFYHDHSPDACSGYVLV